MKNLEAREGFFAKMPADEIRDMVKGIGASTALSVEVLEPMYEKVDGEAVFAPRKVALPVK